MVSTTCGASPSDGSSSSSSFGRLISAREMASICCSPPESVPPAACVRSCSTREEPEARLEVLLDLRGVAPQVRAELEVLLHGEVEEDAAALGRVRHALAGTSRFAFSPVMSCAAEADAARAAA